MAAFYGTKIIKKEINSNTGQPWKLEDVPKRWRAKTKDWIESHTEV